MITLNVFVKLYLTFFYFLFYFKIVVILLRIILSENDIRRITIGDLPETVDDFCSIIKDKLGLEGTLVVQYQDPEFDNELCNLSSMSELPKDKATLRVKSIESFHTESTVDTASLSSSPDEGLNTQTRQLPQPFPIPTLLMSLS